MNSGNWIALYAAIVGTGALIWQAAVYRFDHHSKIRINVSLIHIVSSVKSRNLLDHPWWLIIDVTNLSKSALQVSSMVIEASLAGKVVHTWQAGKWNLPWRLEAGEPKYITFTNNEGVIALDYELRSRVTTSSGRKFYSKPIIVGKTGRFMFSQKVLEVVLTAFPEYQNALMNSLSIEGFEDFKAELRRLGFNA
jgi:hypothetical protein